ncbi:MAG: thioredoxin-like domain-containing protein [Spirosomataceae bacterium]
MKKHLAPVVFTLLLLGPIVGIAQEKGYHIKLKIKGFKDTTVYLGHYLVSPENFYIQDTTRLNKEGEGEFLGDKPLNQGQYAITLKDKALFELVVPKDQVFSIETDTLNYDKYTKVTGSDENELFFMFRKMNQEKQEEYKALLPKGGAKPDAATQQKLMAFAKEVTEQRQQFLQKNEKYLFARIIKSAQEPIIPEAFRQKLTGKPDSANQVFLYYRSHYFDNIDFSEELSFRMSFIKSKIKYFLNNLTVQRDDSIAKAADYIVTLSKNNPATKKLLLWQLISKAETPDSPVAPDGLFQYLAKKYYVGEPSLWDTSTIRRIAERAKATEGIIMGKKIPQMHLTDTLGRAFWLHNIQAKFLFVVIYDPNCSHCRELIPKIVKIQDQIKANNGAVLLVSGPREDKPWRQFIREFKTQKLINGIDLHIDPQTKKLEGHTDFEKLFGINGYPLVLIVDKDKKIIAKSLPIDNYVNFLQFMNKQDAKAAPAAKSAK